LRRTLMAFEGAVGTEGLVELAAILAGVLGWTAERQRDEVARCARLLRERHGVSLNDVETRAA
jgi:glycerol-3-phosphate dehydrogenase